MPVCLAKGELTYEKTQAFIGFDLLSDDFFGVVGIFFLETKS